MKTKFLLVLVLFMGSLAFMSCNDSLVSDEVVSKQETAVIAAQARMFSASNIEMCGTESFTLWAGQTNNSGTVTVANDDVNLYVTYTTTGGLLINEVHLFISANPFTQRLAPGQAIYKAENVNAETHTFVLPLAEIGFECGSTIYLQAHAALSNGETAYGGTITKPKKGAWYGNIAYTIVCCVVEPPVTECTEETAFGGYSGINVGEPGAWFYYFDVTQGSSQPIYAGQYIEVGEVIYENGTISIFLYDNVSLQDVSEPVKIQGFESVPAKRLPAGQFTTYKGTSTTVEVPTFTYYIIHLDVKICEGSGPIVM